MLKEKERPYLLLSNDDGYAAKGLQTLIDTLRPHYDLLVVAPFGPRSAMSNCITTRQPIVGELISREDGLEIYACSGTPVDCVKLAINRYIRRQPNLVIGGINHGDNSSVNAHYSGTLGVVTEGSLNGFPSIAFSLCNLSDDADFNPLRPYLLQFVDMVLRDGLPPWTCLNINFPVAQTFKGIKYCRMAKSRWVEEVVDCPHPYMDGKHFWLAGESIGLELEAEDTDRWALNNGYIAVTPQTTDTTAYALLDTLRKKG